MYATRSRLVTNALAVGGVLLSLGLIAVSAMLNFRMAYRMGDTALDGWVYGSGASVADGLKAMLPFFVWWAWCKREWVAAGVGGLLFVVFTAYSFTAGMGYAAQLRASSEGIRLSAAEARADLEDEEARVVARLDKLGVQRGEEEIAAGLEAVFARVLGKTTVGAYSKNCTMARNWSRHSCAEAAELRQELARADGSAALRGQLDEVRKRLRKLGEEGAGGGGDPQLAALEAMAHQLGWPVNQKGVRLALLVLVGLLFELGSGLGFYVATVPWRSGGVMERTLEPVKAAVKPGNVEEFALARLAPARGKGVTNTAVFQDYVEWCRGRGEAPWGEADFLARFSEMASACKLKVRQRGANVMYMGVKLVDAGATATETGTASTAV